MLLILCTGASTAATDFCVLASDKQSLGGVAGKSGFCTDGSGPCTGKHHFVYWALVLEIKVCVLGPCTGKHNFVYWGLYCWC